MTCLSRGHRSFLAAVGLSLTAAVPSAWASDYAARRGWFFYLEPPVVEEEEPILVVPEPEPPLVTNQAEEPAKAAGPPAFSTAWLREFYPKVRDRAIDDPTPENVRAERYLTRLMLDRAEHFALATAKVVQEDPRLDENVRRPTMPAFSSSMDIDAAVARDALSVKLADEGELWMFHEGAACRPCVQQLGILKSFQARIGIGIRAISLTDDVPDWGVLSVRDGGQARALGVEVAPTTLFASRYGGISVISHGPVAQDVLQMRLVEAGGELGLLTQQEVVSARAVRPALPVDMTTMAAQLEALGEPDDVDAVVAAISQWSDE